jgi:hypothetical protein
MRTGLFGHLVAAALSTCPISKTSIMGAADSVSNLRSTIAAVRSSVFANSRPRLTVLAGPMISAPASRKNLSRGV